MKDLLRKGLDAYDARQERKEDELAELVVGNVDALAHRPTLKLYVLILASVNIICWGFVILVPRFVLAAFTQISEVDDKFVFFGLAILFGVGMWLTYAIFRWIFPDLESTQMKREVMSAFAEQENSTRKVRIWVTSAACGALNLLALAIVEGLLVSN
ncbi:MAG: hypothetical protein QM785_18455 [Pyrinomonadaceae bacterium]